MKLQPYQMGFRELTKEIEYLENEIRKAIKDERYTTVSFLQAKKKEYAERLPYFSYA